METEKEKTSAEESSKTEESVSFSQVTAVATEWIQDFLFVSLCRHFKEGNLDEFNKTITTFQGISQSHLRQDVQTEKVLIGAFLARLMHGKQLDVIFEDDKKVMPLMSAAQIWSDLKKTAEDESLAQNMTILLCVQSVAVCLEKGQRSSASFVIQWLEKNVDFPPTLRAKLGTVMTEKDDYPPFLMSFNYTRLLETTQTYLDAYLAKNPSDYLLKAATKMVQSSGNRDALRDAVPKGDALSQADNESKVKVREKSKRKLLSTRMRDVWCPESCKKSYVCLKRINSADLTAHTKMDTLNIKKERKQRTKWTCKLDSYLVEGVNRHGLGQWSRILLDYDFEGRTGTMLKDRWRNLQKAHKV